MSMPNARSGSSNHPCLHSSDLPRTVGPLSPVRRSRSDADPISASPAASCNPAVVRWRRDDRRRRPRAVADRVARHGASSWPRVPLSSCAMRGTPALARRRPRAPPPIWSPRSTAHASGGWPSRSLRSPPGRRDARRGGRRARRHAPACAGCIDPIDGTVNFVLGLPQYAVSVAAEVDGRRRGRRGVQPGVGRAVPRPRSAAAPSAASDRLHRAARRSRSTGRWSAPASATSVALRARQGGGRRRGCCRGSPTCAGSGRAASTCAAVAAGRLDAYFEAGLNAGTTPPGR